LYGCIESLLIWVYASNRSLYGCMHAYIHIHDLSSPRLLIDAGDSAAWVADQASMIVQAVVDKAYSEHAEVEASSHEFILSNYPFSSLRAFSPWWAHFLADFWDI
jgi:hypothetical protein